nr:MAG TPA: Golgin subfamily A member 5 [Caudoviricetes sp.]
MYLLCVYNILLHYYITVILFIFLISQNTN